MQGSRITDADKKAIKKIIDDFTAQVDTSARDWMPEWVKLAYTEDAMVFPPNAPALKGQDAIAAFMVAFPPLSDFKQESIEVEGNGDLLYDCGSFSWTMTLPGAAPVKETGKYIQIWRKQVDGSWKMSREIFNSDVPAATP